MLYLHKLIKHSLNIIIMLGLICILLIISLIFLEFFLLLKLSSCPCHNWSVTRLNLIYANFHLYNYIYVFEGSFLLNMIIILCCHLKHRVMSISSNWIFNNASYSSKLIVKINCYFEELVKINCYFEDTQYKLNNILAINFKKNSKTLCLCYHRLRRRLY